MSLPQRAFRYFLMLRHARETHMKYLALLLTLLPSIALAGECDQWTAAMEEDEGGSVMTARICAGTGNAAHELFVRCGGPDNLSIRFIPVAPTGYPPEGPEFKTDLEFAFGSDVVTRNAHYEDMDGAMVTDLDIGTPFAQMLQSRPDMKVRDVSGIVPGATFSLNGAKAALDKLIKSCSSP
jgi:hypothetical protein